MYPPRHPSSMQPSQNVQNPKVMFSELCDRLKDEYSSACSHIQTLKTEIDKINSQRAETDRYCTLQHDIIFTFNNEIHKLMDIIKRLTGASIQNVGYLPPEIQQNIMLMIDQVKQYTSTEFQSIVAMQQQINHMNPHHHMQSGVPGPINMPPHHVGMSGMMPPPGIHSNNPHMSHMPPPPPHMMPPYQNRLPGPNSISTLPDPNGMYQPDQFRPYPGREKEISCPQNISDSSNGGGKDKPKNLDSKVSNNSSIDHQRNMNIMSPDGSNEIDANYDKCDNAENGIYRDQYAEQGNNSEGSGSPRLISNSGNVARTSNNTGALKRMSESLMPISSSQFPNRAAQSPNRKVDRPIPLSAPSRTPSHSSQMRMPMPMQSPYYNMMMRPPHISSYLKFLFGLVLLSEMTMMPPPPFPPHPHMTWNGHGMRNHLYDNMMMMRNNSINSGFPPQPYPGVIPHGQVSGYSHYQPDFCDNSMYGPPNGSSYGGSAPYPRSLNPLSSLVHGDVVCAVSFSNPLKYVITGSKGTVKIWDVSETTQPKLSSTFECMKESYVRAVKCINDIKTLIVCGEYNTVGIYNIVQTNGSVVCNLTNELTNPAPVCYDMKVGNDEKNFFCCCSDGSIVNWDIETNTIVRSYTGHVDGVTCIDFAKDGNTFWTGGLDTTARCWDVREPKQINLLSFPTQVFAISVSPSMEYVVVGLENKTIEMVNIRSDSRLNERNVFKVHESCVLTVKIAKSGSWLLSSSKDNYTNCVKMPSGMPIFMTREGASVISTDISFDDKYVVTGGGDKKASLYECVY